MKARVFAGALALAWAGFADVIGIRDEIVVDGRLDEAVWAQAHWETGFRKLANVTVDREVKAQTSFAVLASDRTLYVGVRCAESDMKPVREREPKVIWGDNSIELFVSPSGSPMEFYHFAVGFNRKNANVAEFAGEGGAIHPDPYAPEWKGEATACEGGWSVEFAIPLSAFYMTRNAVWSRTWLVNVTRNRFGAQRELTTWSPLQTGFLEPKLFRQIAGFPLRRSTDDVALRDVSVKISGRKGELLVGTLELEATVKEPGLYVLSSPAILSREFELPAGDSRVSADCHFPANGRHLTELTLTRKATGESYARKYPVVVDFEDIRVKLTSPEYRDNFYPGQDSTHVAGRVECVAAGQIRLSLEGAGIPKTEQTLSASGSFSFETPSFTDGEAFLTVTASDGAMKKVKIRKLAPTGRRMAWISKGNLIVDGKPVLRRNLYATYYLGGAAFKEKYERDLPTFGVTTEVTAGGTLEPGRVISGLERKEAILDVYPCKEYLEKLDRKIEESKDKDFVYWYISDEPECRGVSPIYLRHVYEYMKEKDPYHVILTASRGGKRYVECADWFETHPYLNPNCDAAGKRRYSVSPAEMGGYLDAFDVYDRSDKCVGFLPTAFAYRYTSLLNDYPTFPEYVCHVWAAMMHGGKTLFPFMWADMGHRPATYEGTRYVFTSFGALQDFVLHARRTWLVRSDTVKAVRYDLPDESMFVLVNLTQEPQQAALPDLGATFGEFRGTRTFTGGAFKLAPLEVVIGTTKPHDRGLPSFAATKAEVDRQEAERLGRDNQLLEHYEDVVWAGSKSIGTGYGLIDGVRDLMMFSQQHRDETFLEMSFPRSVPTFSTMRVFGRWESKPVVSVLSGGDWLRLEPEKVKPLEDGVELTFAKAVRSVKVKISFLREGKGGKNGVEIYEIELAKHPASTFGTAVAPVTFTRPKDARWILDGTNCETSPSYSGKAWFGKDVRTKATENGGFEITGAATRLVSFEPDAPWVTARFEAFESLAEHKYLAWSLYSHDKRIGWLMGTVTHPQAGLYTVRLPPVTNRVEAPLNLQNCNFKLRFGYIANERQPADCLSCVAANGEKVQKIGDSFTVRLDLAEPCEDVSAVLLCDRAGGGGFRPFNVNGTNALALKRTDGTGRHWEVTVRVARVDNDTRGHAVFIRAAVLGGKLDLPIFTKCPFSFAS